MKINCKNALITGANRGIGRQIALTLADAGNNILVAHSGAADSAAEAEEVAAEAKRRGVDAYAVGSNIATLAGVEALYQSAAAYFGHFDILVNNAGIDGHTAFLETDERTWEAMLDTDLKPVYRLCRLVLPEMIQRRYGRIISISSICAMTGVGWTNKACYAAAKAAIIGFSKCLANEVGPYGITVNVVAPGPCLTDMNRKILTPDVQAGIEQKIPVRRIGMPKDIANAVAFFADEAQSYVTGQLLSPNGGMVM